jgi:2-polyprenyl-3-methyl-5-hydroxy-6-metoxy-1,4-benzoquinol methylase
VNSHPAEPSPNEPVSNSACPICCKPEVVAWFSGKDRLFGLAPGVFSLLRCTFCGCIFQQPLPDEASLATFYPQKYWWSEAYGQGSGPARLFRNLEKAYRELVVADHVRFLDDCSREKVPGGKRLLDIGCGSGTFLQVAQTHGYIPYGMDQSARAIEIIKRQYGFPARKGNIGRSVWDDCRFDFITMFHVLEHLTDPRPGLRYIRDWLEPGGILILQVPNMSSLQARLFGRFWYGLDVPRHVINYTPEALGCLLRDAGFDFRIIPRFSLRDNPASIASSLVPWLDPVRRKGRCLNSNPIWDGVIEIAYLGLVLLVLPAAYLESLLGFGGTLWAYAWKKQEAGVRSRKSEYRLL